MPVVTILPQNKAVEAAEGTSLLKVIQDAAIEFVTKCGGNAKCGQCHIYVQEGRKSVSKIQRAENELLDTLVGIGSKSRLACQTLLGPENVTVELLGFSSGV